MVPKYANKNTVSTSKTCKQVVCFFLGVLYVYINISYMYISVYKQILHKWFITPS